VFAQLQARDEKRRAEEFADRQSEVLCEGTWMNAVSEEVGFWFWQGLCIWAAAGGVSGGCGWRMVKPP
jgi:hypothetical protein